MADQQKYSAPISVSPARTYLRYYNIIYIYTHENTGKEDGMYVRVCFPV